VANVVIDAHLHVGDDHTLTGVVPPLRLGADFGPGDPELVLNALVERLDRRGVDKAVAIAPSAYLRPDGLADTRQVNDHVASYRDSRPDRVPAAVGTVEPLYGERGLAELDRCARELDMKGISFHNRFQGVSNDSIWVRRYIERIGELGLIVFMHAVGEAPAEHLWKTAVVARDFPEVQFVILDAFSTFDQSLLVPYVAESCPNTVFDTSLSHNWMYIQNLVDRCGSSRLLYGGETLTVADVRSTGLDREDFDCILGGNISRLLDLDQLGGNGDGV
jgi:predicted TIM-barrel fold metal-dependent hydrolase